MGTIKSKIAKGGLALAVLGIISILLSFFNYNVKLLAWIDLWGSTMGWVIRILLGVGGAALFYLLGSDEDAE